MVQIIKPFHEGMAGAVRIAGDTGEPFTINHGVKQGCVLTPTLFSLYLAAVLESMCTNLNSGVFIKTRTDGKLFNLARLRASAKAREICVRELFFADDSALVATNPTVIQEIADRLSCTARHFGMKINVSKTGLLYQPVMCVVCLTTESPNMCFMENSALEGENAVDKNCASKTH